MNHVLVPDTITTDDIGAREASWSAGAYRTITIPTPAVKPVRDLLAAERPFDKGVEPGSLWYMRRSSHYLVRTKALQDHSSLLYPRGDAIVPINPRFEHYIAALALSDGDILMSKDSNIGNAAIIDGQRWAHSMFSSGIVRLHPAIDRYYLFAFLKHPLFKDQLDVRTARGVTIRHAKDAWLDCLIPMPNQQDHERVMRYVSALMQAIVEKEKAILQRNARMNAAIEAELTIGQRQQTFTFAMPTSNDLLDLSRLDAGLYSQNFKRQQFQIDNYVHGGLGHMTLDAGGKGTLGIRFTEK